MLDAETVAALDERARLVGVKIGWTLNFIAGPNPDVVALVADGIDDHGEVIRIAIHGPMKTDPVTAHEVDLLLDQLESGERTIGFDEDGDPTLR